MPVKYTAVLTGGPAEGSYEVDIFGEDHGYVKTLHMGLPGSDPKPSGTALRAFLRGQGWEEIPNDTVARPAAVLAVRRISER